MKKYFYNLLLLLTATTLFVACSEDEGTDAGNDSKTVVTINTYAAESPYDADVDVRLRVAANDATSEAYVLAESTADYDSHVASMGQNGYNSYVVENGKKIYGIAGASVADTVLVNMPGENTITVVAVGKGGMYSAKTTFTGAVWNDVATGTYYYSSNASQLFGAGATTTLQVKDEDANTYRFKDLYGAGNHVTFTLTGQSGQVQGETVRILEVPAQATPYTYGSYGTVYLADMITRQAGNYPSYIYSDNTVVMAMVYYVNDGSLVSGYDQFVPDN